jgi:hypothetical protein
MLIKNTVQVVGLSTCTGTNADTIAGHNHAREAWESEWVGGRGVIRLGVSREERG